MGMRRSHDIERRQDASRAHPHMVPKTHEDPATCRRYRSAHPWSFPSTAFGRCTWLNAGGFLSCRPRPAPSKGSAPLEGRRGVDTDQGSTTCGIRVESPPLSSATHSLGWTWTLGHGPLAPPRAALSSCVVVAGEHSVHHRGDPPHGALQSSSGCAGDRPRARAPPQPPRPGGSQRAPSLRPSLGGAPQSRPR